MEENESRNKLKLINMAKQIHEEKMNKGNEQCRHSLPPGNKINASWIRDVTDVNETINVPEENIGELKRNYLGAHACAVCANPRAARRDAPAGNPRDQRVWRFPPAQP